MDTTGTAKKLTDFNALVLSRYKIVADQLKGSDVDITEHPEFQKNLLEFMSVVNIHFITTGEFINQQDPIDPNAKDEKLKGEGFAVSGQPQTIHPELAEMKSVQLALALGANLDEDEETLTGQSTEKK